MCEIVFSKAKNGSTICSKDNILFHSSYNPEIEAKRFVDNINVPFLPQFILIIEPALSYSAAYLRIRFPNSKLCAIRFCSSFQKYDYLFDKVFYFTDLNITFIENELFNYMGEEGIFSCIFTSWSSCEKIFPLHSQLIWKAIKNVTVKSKAVLITHSFFAQRWLKNSFSFCNNVQNTAILQKGNIPIVVAASGISLKKTLYFLQQYRKYFFLISVSSALPALIYKKIIPDLVISTDGGYWAKKHLEILEKNIKIPLAISPEGNCSKKILRNSTVIPIEYSDGLESKLLKHCGFKSVLGKRNGTVSGTAVELALDLTEGNIFLCGLDLCASNGFQHVQPNYIEENACVNDYRLNTKEMRNLKAAFNSEALNIYENWFISKSNIFSKRVFRLSDNFKYKNKLGNIKDVNFLFFKKYIKNLPKNLKNVKIISSKNLKSKKEIKKISVSFLKENSCSENWLKNIFPSEYISIKKEFSIKNKEEKKELLLKKNKELIKKIRKLCCVI